VTSPYQLLKRGKVDLLAAWLRDGKMVESQTPQAREMSKLFLDVLDSAGKEKKGGRVKKKEDGEGANAASKLVTKMDDLSDAVLQGMVWVQWQRNLEKLIKEWPELLQEEHD
jgi:cruciform cutting endonuclease 1